jgi:hypothetical protein
MYEKMLYVTYVTSAAAWTEGFLDEQTLAKFCVALLWSEYVQLSYKVVIYYVKTKIA